MTKNNKGIKSIAMLLVAVFALGACAQTVEKEETAVEENMGKNMEETTEDGMKDEETTDKKNNEDKEEKTMMGEEEMTDEQSNDDKIGEEMMTMKNEGKSLDDYTFEDLDGNIVKLSDLEGEKTYLKFWASWCSVCLSTLGETDKFFTEDIDYNAYTVVSPDEFGEMSKEDFKEWYAGLGYKNIKILFDQDGKLAKDIGLRGFPSAAFIGSDRVLVDFRPGHYDKAVIEGILDKVY